jgi:AcrR family transcriptional regulator
LGVPPSRARSRTEPSTRDRILASAQERFISQGFDGTSLREIADDLGFTKAALYYHFQTKEEILEALLEPAHELIDSLFARLEAATDVEQWRDALFWVIDQMKDKLDFFRLIERNRAVIEHSHFGDDFFSDHAEMHRRFEDTVRRLSPDIAQRVRLVSALAAVTGFDDWAPGILLESDWEQIATGLRAVIADILRLER